MEKRNKLFKRISNVVIALACVAGVGFFTGTQAKAAIDSLYVTDTKDGVYASDSFSDSSKLSDSEVPGITSKDGVVTLNNCTFISGGRSVIHFNGNMTLNVIGTNTLTSSYQCPTDSRESMSGIYSDGSLKITGDGILNVTSPAYLGGDRWDSIGIHVSDALTIDMTGTINTNGNDADDLTAGIYTDNFIMKSGTVNAYPLKDNNTAIVDGMKIIGKSAGIFFDESFTMSGGTINAEGYSGTFSCGIGTYSGNMTMSGGVIHAKAQHAGVLSVGVSVGYTSGQNDSTLTLTGGKIYTSARIAPDFSYQKCGGASLFASKMVNAGNKLKVYSKDSAGYYSVAGSLKQAPLEVEIMNLTQTGYIPYDAAGNTVNMDVMIAENPEQNPAAKPPVVKPPVAKTTKLAIKSAKVKGKNKVVVRWTKETGFKSYQIFIATDRKMKVMKYRFIVKKGSTKTFNYNGLKTNAKGSPIFVKMRTVKKVKGKYKYGKWTKIYRINTK